MRQLREGEDIVSFGLRIHDEDFGTRLGQERAAREKAGVSYDGRRKSNQPFPSWLAFVLGFSSATWLWTSILSP